MASESLHGPFGWDGNRPLSGTDRALWIRIALIVVLSLAALGQAGSLIPGRPDRIVQVFDEHATLLSETSYRDGRKVGRHVSFWPGGGRRVEAFYNGDVIEGEYRSWHANGRLAEVKHYARGHQAGMQQAWTDQGELYLNFEVRNGRHYGLINARPCLPVRGQTVQGQSEGTM